MNLRDAILSTSDHKIQSVDVPEWGVPVFVRSMNVREAIAFDGAKESIEDEKVVALYVASTLCDAQGVLAVDPASEVDLLLGKNPDVLERIFKAALKLNGSDTGSDEDREKNS